MTGRDNIIRFAGRRSNIIQMPLLGAAREGGDELPATLPAKIDCIECLRRESAPPPSTLERIGDALAGPLFLPVYLGFVAGCFTTVALAFVWSLAL